MIHSTARRAVPVLCLAWLASVAAPAFAQPGAPPPPAAPAEPSPVPPPPVDPARATYDAAFAALVAGELATAAAGFDEAAATSTDPELRASARELRRLVDSLTARQARIVVGPAPAPTAPAAPYTEDPDEGRTAFVVTTTLASLYAGIALIDLTDIDDARAGTALVTGTTALGFVGSLFGSRGRTITSGTADAYSLGMTLGAANALLLAEPLGASSSETWQAGVLGGMALGSAAGFLYGANYRPTSGQITFAGTLATLGIASSGLGLVLTQPDVDSDAVLYTMTAGLDVGAAAGLVLGHDLTWSPGRARLVWLGSLLGALGGVATTILIMGTDDDSDTAARVIAGSALAGVWGGFGLAVHLTRNMRPDRRFLPAVSDLQVTPVAVRRGAGLGISGRF